MREILNKNYSRIGASKFYKTAPLVCFFSDALVLYYVVTIQLKELINPRLIESIIRFQNPNIAQNMSGADFQEITFLMQNQMSFMMTCFLIFHGIIYFLAAGQKKWPTKYVHRYAFVAVLFTILEFSLMLFYAQSFSIYTFISFFGYLFVTLGYSHFKSKKVEQ